MGTGDYAAIGADNFATGGALFNAAIAADVAVAVERDALALAFTGIAGGALHGSGIAVARKLHLSLAFAIAQRDLRHCYGRLHDGVGVERDLHA
jgi:hypothetical protein